jgi:hypothetical protein
MAMSDVLSFLRARLAERSSRVQLLVLVLALLVATGLVSFESLSEFSGRLTAVAALVGPLLGVLVPDTNHDVNAAAVADATVSAAVSIATAAAEEKAGPGATELARNLAGLAGKLGL